MTPRDYVKAAIEPRETDRVPYNIALTKWRRSAYSNIS